MWSTFFPGRYSMLFFPCELCLHEWLSQLVCLLVCTLLASKGCVSGLDSRGQHLSRSSGERGCSEYLQRILETGALLSLGEGEPRARIKQLLLSLQQAQGLLFVDGTSLHSVVITEGRVCFPLTMAVLCQTWSEHL